MEVSGIGELEMGLKAGGFHTWVFSLFTLQEVIWQFPCEGVGACVCVCVWGVCVTILHVHTSGDHYLLLPHNRQHWVSIATTLKCTFTQYCTNTNLPYHWLCLGESQVCLLACARVKRRGRGRERERCWFACAEVRPLSCRRRYWFADLINWLGSGWNRHR